MKAFLSWPGELSRQLAEAFNDWLPGALEGVDPFFSPDDIAKGKRWSTDLYETLDNIDHGILFITPENAFSNWVHYEAGALATNSKDSRVIPLLFQTNKPQD